MHQAHSLDAIVVGAGLSGLSAAHELKKAGLDILVLEARNRPGGRTGVVEWDGLIFDTGGEWVDEAHTEIQALAAEIGVEIYPYERRKEDARWYINGRMSTEMPLSKKDAEIYVQIARLSSKWHPCSTRRATRISCTILKEEL